jgi:hypothetical protein
MEKIMNLSNMRTEDVAALIKQGIGDNFERELYKYFIQEAEAIARKTAKELASRISANVSAARSDANYELRVDMNFTMASERAAIVGSVVDVKNGVPLVAWSGNTAELVGKKVFVQ